MIALHLYFSLLFLVPETFQHFSRRKKSRRKKHPSAEPVAALSAAEMKIVEQAEAEEEEANQQHQIDIPADLTSSEDISEEL